MKLRPPIALAFSALALAAWAAGPRERGSRLPPDRGVTPRFRATPERDAVTRQSVLFNQALARPAAARGVVVVDLYAASRAEVPHRPELVASDGYHPSDAGYARWAELMWAVIAPLVPAR